METMLGSGDEVVKQKANMTRVEARVNEEKNGSGWEMESQWRVKEVND